MNKIIVKLALFQKQLFKSIKLHRSPYSVLNQSAFKMEVTPILALKDNYMYVLVDKKTKQCAVVDPVEPKKILEYTDSLGLNISKVLTTHHHWDHANGNPELLAELKQRTSQRITVYGGDDRIPAMTNKVAHNDTIDLGSLKITCLFTPCHTTGHICYFVESPDDSQAVVFTGDTLFIAGCGRFFEGTADQMYRALVTILSKLPGNTKVYCGHEYTVNNLSFALTIEPNNVQTQDKLNWSQEQRKSNHPTIPSTIEQERSFNPFLRVHELSVQQSTGQQDPIECMRVLRERKDKW